jgi:hypothetical protein
MCWLSERLHQSHPRALWTASVVLWCLAVAAGFGFLGKYEATPGPATAAPASWPSDSRLHPNAHRPCLVVALHPHCPCSRATLAELEEISQRCGERLDLHILFYTPTGCGSEWAQTDLWERAMALAGVTVWTDVDGKEGQRFGALTSGHVALYGSDGRLLFHGGITRARGHAGDNDGREAVLAHVLGTAQRARTEVFGCPLCERPLLGDMTGDTECRTR